MDNRATLLMLIPARGGSKGIPGKNIRLLNGKPLIAWTIEAARKECGCLSRIVVSTDSSDIARVAERYGAEVPFVRPADLAGDATPALAVVSHAVHWFETHERYLPELVMYLQPTSPLRTSGDIKASVNLLIEKAADAVVSVSPVQHHPYWMKKLDDEGRMSDFMVQPDLAASRQELPSVYSLNGAIYLSRRDILLKRKTWYTNATYAYIMPTERSIDVDSLWDWWLVESVLNRQLGELNVDAPHSLLAQDTAASWRDCGAGDQ